MASAKRAVKKPTEYVTIVFSELSYREPRNHDWKVEDYVNHAMKKTGVRRDLSSCELKDEGGNILNPQSKCVKLTTIRVDHAGGHQSEWDGTVILQAENLFKLTLEIRNEEGWREWSVKELLKHARSKASSYDTEEARDSAGFTVQMMPYGPNKLADAFPMPGVYDRFYLLNVKMSRISINEILRDLPRRNNNHIFVSLVYAGVLLPKMCLGSAQTIERVMDSDILDVSATASIQSLFFIAQTGKGKSSLGRALSWMNQRHKLNRNFEKACLYNVSSYREACKVVHITARRGSSGEDEQSWQTIEGRVIQQYVLDRTRKRTQSSQLLENMSDIWRQCFDTELMADDPIQGDAPTALYLKRKDRSDSPLEPISRWSDGQKAAFCALYLVMRPGVSQDLPHLFIVDEPEAHTELGSAIPFWAHIMKWHESSLFVFLTQSVRLLQRFQGTSKIYVLQDCFHEQEGLSPTTQFFWTDFTSIDKISTLDVLIEGGSNQVLFCEGEEGSLDKLVYALVYQNAHVLPVGSCSDVVQKSEAYRKSCHGRPGKGNKKIKAIIDKDLRLKHPDRVAVLETSDVESLLCTEGVAEVVRKRFSDGGRDQVKAKIWQRLLEGFVQNDEEIQIQVEKFTEENSPTGGDNSWILDKDKLATITRYFNLTEDQVKHARASDKAERISLTDADVETFESNLRSVQTLDEFCKVWKLKSNSRDRRKNRSLMAELSQAVFGNACSYKKNVRKLLMRRDDELRDALIPYMPEELEELL
uniref:ATPase AAA-type core domain-containing protein n=1 Tax=Pinguiococcus pyrenoidosus TaxID=172671 RepID=A0A7R9U1Q4_9STRA|mmetsp:Transcript_1146/g.4867  ORF Transcript_1146/g.4867 Transcript_1146/m.4867 type:complete len:758 (+) Transcript_1146:194-2467(+)|eukprot:scaffold225_cov235-Pinguiococcus_pyrenoidosus.AAC.11